VREYQSTHGEHRGEKRPPHETIDIDRAAKDLADLRRAEADAQEALANHARQKEIDADRAEGIQAALDRLEGLPPVEPQPVEQQPQQTNGVDPEIARALENPKIREAINQQIQQSEIARQAYAGAVSQLQDAALATLLQAAPELAGVRGDQIPVVVQAIAKSNPQRAEQIAHAVRNAQQNLGVVEQHRQQAVQHQAQQLKTQMDAWDNEYDKVTANDPDIKRVRAEVINVARDHYGIPEKDLAHAWQNEAWIHHPAVQRMITDAVRYRLAQQAVQKAPRPAGRVLKPGMVDTAGAVDYTELTQKMGDFARQPTAKSGAAALMARRRAADR
jgi:hypothetical protein